MKLIAAAFLLFSPVPDDKEAAKLLQDVRRAVLEARTVHVEYEASIGQGGQTYMFMSGTMKVKGDDRWAMDFRIGGMIGGDESKAVSVLYDGRRVIAPGGKAGARIKSIPPKDLGRHVRESLSIAAFLPALLAEQSVDNDKVSQLPEISEVKDGGADRIGAREVRIVRYTLKYPWHEKKIDVEATLDPSSKVVVKREIAMEGLKWKETYKTFSLNTEIPDSDFTYQSKRRLARVQVRLLARSVELFGKFTGRHPRALADLTRKPPELEKDVFWPEDGFLLGGEVPKDPWGRPFRLRREDGSVGLLCLGADGEKGGRHDDEDTFVTVPAVTRQPIGAPNARLRKHYEARVRIRLLAAVVEAYRESYAELPRKKAALWERPDWADVWPDGGWLPAGRMPLDPWGEPYRMISDEDFVRVQVRDPRARILGLRRLTEAEREGLVQAARPRLSKQEREELRRLLADLGDDSPIRRDQAHGRLMNWGFPTIPFVEERLKVEKDPEAIGRLSTLRRSIRAPKPAWKTELAALVRTVRESGGASGTPAVNERNASTTLKTFASAQADFRANDREGNRVNDFWTGDVAGLYCMTNVTTRGNEDLPIKLIELSAAAADAAPLEDGAAGGEYRGIETFSIREPKAGYFYQALVRDNSVTPPVDYRQNTRGKPDMGKVHNTSRFGICAYPEEYGVTGVRTYIINESNTLFWKDTAGESVTEWPSAVELRNDWTKLD